MGSMDGRPLSGVSLLEGKFAEGGGQRFFLGLSTSILTNQTGRDRGCESSQRATSTGRLVISSAPLLKNKVAVPKYFVEDAVVQNDQVREQ